MADYLNTTFGAVSQTPLTSFTNDDGSTWLQWFLSSGSGVPQVYPSFNGVLASGNPGRQIYRSSNLAGSPNGTVVGQLYIDANAGYENIGVGTRLNSAGTAAYFFLRNRGLAVWQIYRLSSGTATLLGASASSTLTTGASLSYEFNLNNSGSDVVLSLKINGVEVIAPVTDVNPGAAFQAAGYAGVYFESTIAASGIFIDSIVATAASSAATAITVSGPTSGAVGSPSSNFTVSANGTLAGTVRVTPSSANGTFSPAFVDISPTTPTGTFTYTPSSSGAKSISFTNNGGLTNPAAITYTASSSGATATTLSGPSSGSVGVASSAFAVGANGAISGTVRITPNDGGAGGSFSPAFIDINSASPNGSFTYTAANAGSRTIGTTNNGGLANPATISYTAAASGTITGAALYSNIRFSPGNWEITATKAKTFHAGAYMKLIFDGTSLALNFDVTNGFVPVPQLVYRIDGCGPWFKVPLAATVSFPVPADTANSASHYIEIVSKVSGGTNTWTSDNGAIILTGAVLDAGKSLHKPLTPAVATTMWFGDSITAGDVSQAGSGNNASDAQAGWAYQIANLLNSEFGIIAYGGTRWIGVAGGGVPGLVDSWNYLSAGVPRDITTSPPKLIVINMGTNDGSDVTAAVTSTLNGMLAATPGTTRIAVMRPFIGYHASELQAGIAACSSPSRVSYIDTTGMLNTANTDPSGLHPLAFENVSHIVPQLYPLIAAALAGTVIPPTLFARTVTTTLKSFANVVRANLSNLNWNWRDSFTGAVLSSGTTGATDGAGVFTVSVQSTHASGAAGWLEITDSDGTLTQNPVAKIFAGPVAAV